MKEASPESPESTHTVDNAIIVNTCLHVIDAVYRLWCTLYAGQTTGTGHDWQLVVRRHCSLKKIHVCHRMITLNLLWLVCCLCEATEAQLRGHTTNVVPARTRRPFPPAQGYGELCG